MLILSIIFFILGCLASVFALAMVIYGLEHGLSRGEVGSASLAAIFGALFIWATVAFNDAFESSKAQAQAVRIPVVVTNVVISTNWITK